MHKVAPTSRHAAAQAQETGETRMYTISQHNPDTDTYTEVEMGLSGGEVRQSILDRVRGDLHHEDENGLDWRTRVMCRPQDLKAIDGAYRQADKAIYAMNDTQIEGDWVFTTSGRIKVTQDDEN